MTITDYKTERENDVSKIKSSAHPKKVVVAGPGTGKSFLFQELIREKKKSGKTDFVAITFIGKLGDALADDLCGLAETMTMHGFARRFVLDKCKGWIYYPRIYDVIKADLKSEGIDEFEIGDDNYKKKTIFYKAVGDEDVVHYAIQICEKDKSKIPTHDLILIDEFQDFNEKESRFVDLLAEKNEIVIVGDDDQALYEFKGSSPTYIRNKHHTSNNNFESHTLRFCSRCTDVIIKYFHALVDKFNLKDPAKNRIEKDYICYVPDKEKDSKANPQIHLIKNCPSGMIAFKIRAELEKLISEQKIKDVLIIGEGRSCKTILESIAKQLKHYGFKNVDYSKNNGYIDNKQNVVDAYKFLAHDPESVLGWRILDNPTDQSEKDNHLKNSKTLRIIISGKSAEIKKLKDVDVVELEKSIENKHLDGLALKRLVFIDELRDRNLVLSRPLGNLNITVCNILNSKGLGADVVFLVGFDEGKFPAKNTPTDSEIYQMLVAITRSKKRMYLVNTTGKKTSIFLDCLDASDLDTKEIK